MALFGAGRAFWMPCGQAMTVNLVPKEMFASAVALNSTLFQTAAITGPALGGVFYAFGETALDSSGALLVYAVVIALLIAVLSLLISIRPVRAKGRSEATMPDFFEGRRFVWNRKPVLGAISLDLFAVLFGGATALLPMFAADVLHVGPVGLGVLRSAPGVGAALVAVWLAQRPITRHAGTWMFGGVALYGVATVVFGQSTSFVLSAIALFAIGCGDMVSVFVRHLLVQLETPDALRGRMTGINMVFFMGGPQLGELEAGAAARLLGAPWSVITGGIGCVVATLIVAAATPRLRTYTTATTPAA